MYEWSDSINMLLVIDTLRRAASQVFFSSAACRRAANVSVNFTVNECSSSGCLVPHVLKPAQIALRNMHELAAAIMVLGVDFVGVGSIWEHSRLMLMLITLLSLL